jgi:hypothetical protein
MDKDVPLAPFGKGDVRALRRLFPEEHHWAVFGGNARELFRL